MKIAITGIRGIPACYGGFETFAEELSTRLVQRGHEVIVYGRKHVIKYAEPLYRGVNIRLLPAPRHKYLETPVHSLLSFIEILRRRVDVVLVCNAANSPFLWILRLARIPTVVNVDGIERKRAKWNILGKLWYRLGEFSSVLFASELVSDAEVIRSYYREKYRRDSTVIRYGYSEALGGKSISGEPLARTRILGKKTSGDDGLTSRLAEGNIFQELRIAPGRYLLYVSRLEPENNAHRVIAAYNKLPLELQRRPLLIVGDAPYAKDYILGLRSQAGNNIHFLGFRFGEDYQLLQLGAYLYIQATEVGGTHPALVEAMGYANCIVANDTPENREVLGNAGMYYRKNDEHDLSQILRFLVANEQQVLSYRKAALLRAEANFSWPEIVNEYEQLFQHLLTPRKPDQQAAAANT